jgi:hypothetical protein
MSPLGVGVIGAGPVTQAIHIPALATLPERLQVRHIMDVDQSVATEVAGRVGARASTDVQSVLDDASVDIVAICSPPQFHADQVAAACEAGKKAILCEKPLATSADEAHRIAQASRTSGVPIIVGTMHAYDPAYVAASHAWSGLSEKATLVRSVIYLPPNDEMIALATDLCRGAGAASCGGLRSNRSCGSGGQNARDDSRAGHPQHPTRPSVARV